jgi:prolyl-tRNA synthetase
MRWSQAHIPTLREAPQEAELVSHQLMLRAGMMRRLASGIYSFLPLGWKAIQKFQQIIREEMNRSGGQEVSLPVVQPREIWDESGRWDLYAKEMVRLKDRHENDFCLQPTSEEAIVDLARRDIRSYRQLPQMLYQIQTKFRDEIRPRFGLMRGREFIMKDAYSFDLTVEGAQSSYEKMRQTYRRIFTRAGLQFKPVDADTGSIGGSQSEEFTVLAQSGEDEIVSCSVCDYAANQEKAEGRIEFQKNIHTENSAPSPEKFATPGLKTIEQLAESLSLPASRLVKTMIATDSEGRCLGLLLRGDHELHEVKLQRAFSDFRGVRLASDEELSRWKLPKGSLGPFHFPRVGKEVHWVCDTAVDLDASVVVGANEEGFHWKSVILARDCANLKSTTLRRIQADETCPRCEGKLQVLRGIEVGHVFYLGKKYSEAMKCQVTNEAGQAATIEMGCYGIGVGRTVQAAIEQNHDKDGIVWPLSLAPYEVAVVSLSPGRATDEAQALYEALQKAQVDVIWDDRDLSPGIKLKDCDLVGIPFQIVVGDRGLKTEQVEWKRRGQAKEMIACSAAFEHTMNALRDERQKLQDQLAALDSTR